MVNNKIIWGVVVLIVLSVGAWFYFSSKREILEQPLAEKAVGVHYAGDGMHTIEGTVTLPNPCYTLSVASEKRSGAPEEILLRFTANQTADVCAQVLYSALFRLTFNAEKNTNLSGTINEVPFALEFSKQERVRVEEGSDFLLVRGQTAWVEDLKITFRSVEDESRCPIDVVCIQAGWVTLKFQVGDQEIRLRLPGDSTVPNAAVVGSYVITLIDVEPVPKSAGLEEAPPYSATLRIEVHDSKG